MLMRYIPSATGRIKGRNPITASAFINLGFLVTQPNSFHRFDIKMLSQRIPYFNHLFVAIA